MTEVPAPADDLAATKAQIERFIARFEPETAALIRQARATLAVRLPGATQLVYDNYNALAIGFGPDERASQAVFSLACYASGVLLYFLRGASLADPDGLLRGEGSRGRHVRLSSLAVLDDPRVLRLMEAALAQAAASMSPDGEGRTIVKSIAAKQRPRRRRDAS